MKSVRVCVLGLACVAGALAFGVAANAALDIVIPPRHAAAPSIAKAVANEAAQPAAEATGSFALASTTSTPVDLGPVKVKTIPMLYREDAPAEQAQAPAQPQRSAAVPLPRARPASAPAYEVSGSLARQPGSVAIARAAKINPNEDNGPLSATGIDRMKIALALTTEQEEYWPAIAEELNALGKQLHQQRKTNKNARIEVDADTKQRLYWAAAPLITRLTYEQKQRVKQMAHLMGLTEVAEAL